MNCTPRCTYPAKTEEQAIWILYGRWPMNSSDTQADCYNVQGRSAWFQSSKFTIATNPRERTQMHKYFQPKPAIQPSCAFLWYALYSCNNQKTSNCLSTLEDKQRTGCNTYNGTNLSQELLLGLIYRQVWSRFTVIYDVEVHCLAIRAYAYHQLTSHQLVLPRSKSIV